jgi:hypothetical protein
MIKNWNYNFLLKNSIDLYFLTLLLARKSYVIQEEFFFYINSIYTSDLSYLLKLIVNLKLISYFLIQMILKSVKKTQNYFFW